MDGGEVRGREAGSAEGVSRLRWLLSRPWFWGLVVLGAFVVWFVLRVPVIPSSAIPGGVPAVGAGLSDEEAAQVLELARVVVDAGLRDGSIQRIDTVASEVWMKETAWRATPYPSKEHTLILLACYRGGGRPVRVSLRGWFTGDVLAVIDPVTGIDIR